jgi:hypothetical protein
MATQALPYAYITLSQLRQQIANRLYDPSMVFWSSAELTAYAAEALQTWNALTANWRGDFVFPSSQGVIWYDIPSLTNTLRPYTVTDTSIYNEILYHLLEPITGPVSLQYTTDDIINAVQRRRDELLSITSCTQTITTVGAVAGRITLSDSVIDVRRMAYLPTESNQTGVGYGTGRYGFGLYGKSAKARIDIPKPSVLWPEDTWAEQSYEPLYTLNPAGKPNTPLTYLMSTQPPLSFDTNAPPAFGGSYELLTVNAGGTLSFTVPSLFTIPDDWTHVIKWGALADLFGRASNATDPLRQQYCEKRYEMGCALLSQAPSLLAMRINNVPAQVSSVRGADLYNTSWEGADQSAPRQVYHSGLNLLALSPTPDAGVNSVPYDCTATVVENAPIPVLDADLVQISRDDLDALIDYAVHLAAVKMGGQEFISTMPLFQNFQQQASLYNRKLLEVAEYNSILRWVSNMEASQNPVQQPEEVKQ